MEMDTEEHHLHSYSFPQRRRIMLNRGPPTDLKISNTSAVNMCELSGIQPKSTHEDLIAIFKIFVSRLKSHINLDRERRHKENFE